MAYGRSRFRRFRRGKSSFRRRGPFRRFRRSRRSGRSQKLTRITFRSPIIADKAFIKLTYTTDTTFLLNWDASPVTAPAFGYYGNNLFKPDGNTSIQPEGFDQWKQFYQEYQVLGMAISVQAQNLSPSVPFQICVLPTPSVTGAVSPPSLFPAAVTPHQVRSMVYCRYRFSNSVNDRSMISIKHYMSTKKVLGRSLGNLDPSIMDVKAATPAIGGSWFFAICAQRVPGLTSGIDISIPVHIKIKYYVKFTKRNVNYVDVVAAEEPEIPHDVAGAAYLGENV